MAESEPSGRLPWWRRHWIALTGLVLIVLLAYAVLAVTVLPGFIVSMSGGNPGEDARLKAVVDTRGALLGVLAPLVVVIGAVAAFLNYDLNRKSLEETERQNRETLNVTRRGQLTERFTKAIEQLGDNNLDIRLGGIYALERIAKESEELHGPVMEILTAFLREHSSKPQETAATRAENKGAGDEANHAAKEQAARREALPVPDLSADFQAIATVLGRREVSHDPHGLTFDLRGVALGMVDFAFAQLQKAWFAGAQLQKTHFDSAELQNAGFPDAQLQEATFVLARLQSAWFAGAQLQKTNFDGAELQEATFRGAKLQEATFRGAKLQKATFRGAKLQNADFGSAKLQNAYFLGAQLQGANFEGADLEGAKFQHDETEGADAFGLTPEQFDLALNVDKALLPNYLAGALKGKHYGPSE